VHGLAVLSEAVALRATSLKQIETRSMARIMKHRSARLLYGFFALAAFALAAAYIKLELIDETRPHDPWIAVLWIVCGVVLGWAALTGNDRQGGPTARAAPWMAIAVSAGLVLLILYALSQLS